MIEFKKPIAFIDLETTGVDTVKDRIVEISICKVHPDLTRESKTRRVNPCIPIPEAASKVHGIINSDVVDEPTFKSIAKGILTFIDGCDVAGFNSTQYDMPLPFNEFERAGVKWDYSKCNFIDVGNIYKIQEPRTLAAAVKFYLGTEIDKAHSAEADINATVDVFFKQFEMYPDLPKTAEELNLFSNFGKKRLDMSGWFVYSENGKDIMYGRGKWDKQKVADHMDYVSWMLTTNFIPQDTKDYCLKLMNKKDDLL